MFINNCNSLKKELDSLDIYTINIEDAVIKRRVNHLLEWYIRKATFYKNLFYSMSMTLIIINSMIPIINQLSLENKDIITSVSSSVATILASALTLFTMKDTWFRYRSHVELIKEECMKYTSYYGDYHENRNQYLLSKNIELIISAERNQWKNNKFKEENNVKNKKIREAD